MTKRSAVITIVLIALVGEFGWSIHAALRRAGLSKRLISAVDRYDVPAVRQLLDEGADPDTREGDDPPFDWRESLAALLGRGPRYERSLGTPLLCTAAYGGGADSETGREIVTLLLAKGADVNARSGLSTTYMGSGAIPGETALLDAVARRQGPIVRTLLDAGANVDAQGANGDTALSYAALGDPSLVPLLLGRHAAVNTRNRSGETPLILAAEFAEPDSLRLLIAHGADVNARNAEGHTALWITRHNVSVLRADTFFHRQEKARQVAALLVANGAKE